MPHKSTLYTVCKKLQTSSDIPLQRSNSMKLRCKICGEEGGRTLRFHVKETHGFSDPQLAYKQLEEIENE